MLLIFIQPSPNLPGIYIFTFLQYICQVTVADILIHSGKIFSLMMADKLGDYIVGTAVETIETEKLIKEFEHIIVDDVYGGATPFYQVTNNLQETLQKKGSQINTMAVDNIYNETAETRANTNIWHSSKNIADARQNLSQVCGLNFFTLSNLLFSTPCCCELSHVCPECKDSMLPKRARHLCRSGDRPLVNNRHNESSCLALRETQWSHRKEWFHARLAENQFLVRPIGLTSLTTFDSTLFYMYHYFCTDTFTLWISLVTSFKQVVPATNHRINICSEKVESAVTRPRI